jgi:hypothetical protein
MTEKEQKQEQLPLVAACQKLLAKQSQLPAALKGRGADDACLLVTHEGVLYSWGKVPQSWMNRKPMSRLGSASLRDVPHPTVVKALSEQQVRMVCDDADGCAFFAITRHQVWAWGAQQDGTLGIGSNDDVCYVPRPILTLPPQDKSELIYITGGSRIAGALTSDGRVFTWGLNAWGAGHDLSVDIVTSPSQPDGLREHRIVFLKCAGRYCRASTFAVTDEGVILAPGKSSSVWLPVKPDEKALQALGISDIEAQALAKALVPHTKSAT